ncbi:hypothetical protein LTR10_023574 [Elasticomyces elasticus]|uniref:Uncharacterized protein n=1 Tax=Exophiala sideris TaxID=1016849 RepID=A0ABR0J6U0_9EURO|nr:hypothetical protein LTR10_023574 [Elasticomyces elasticus]KAK5028764.1 hypothetical protein LTS07_006143 [Exophiala sideris]KAK5035633.1 hypothetical protein LTR13_005762 [Exophiala sideris]KAK5057268.1 hypothetical protein LTR69_007307 [Exophiala sideris]KAK5181759.1 hypothetical protein LTR44_005959 [Eurotiomycetes sp. CCFEE 6388]
MDITSLVRAVIAAFEDAIKLVQRIRDQRLKSDGGQLPEEPTRDLLESLALGPAIVRGHYEHDLKRFGEQYACGDIQAREQLKDILINLQMTMITTLRMVYMDDMDLDFGSLQICSDDCRVNAGVCLGQLSQRLSEAAKAQAHYPVSASYSSGAGLMPPMSPSLGYSSSRSTHSSVAFQAPRTPDTLNEQFNNLGISPPVQPHYLERQLSASSRESQDVYARKPVPLLAPVAESHLNAPVIGELKPDRSDVISMRRRSSQALAPDDNILQLFPQPGGQAITGTKPARQDLESGSALQSGNNSQVQSRDISRASSGHQSQNSRERYGPDDFADNTRQFSNGTIYDLYQPPTPERHASSSFSRRAPTTGHNTVEHVRYLQEKSRPPRPQPPRTDSLNAPPQREPLYDHRAARLQTASPVLPPRAPSTRSYSTTPFHSNSHNGHRRPPTAPLPALPPSPPQLQALPPIQPQPSLSQLLSSPSNGAPSIHSVASATPSANPPVPTGPLTLPTDKDLRGFCKGAFRLQAGLERKAFSVANKPAGFSGMISFWRCEKCNFEGPMHNSVNTTDDKKKKGKPEKAFDPKIRVSESGGIRYKWAFLARCHVALKGMVPNEMRDGSFGSYGCIFCCAEAKNRGWLNGDEAQSIRSSTSGSMRSGHTANTAVKVDGKDSVTPIFGNVASFMLHLESVHRGQDGWPNAEMLGRFRVVVGRLAGVHEEGWDINFVPF